MPLWLAKYLPYGIVVLAIALGLWLVYSKGEANATERYNLEKAEDAARQAQADLKLERMVTASEKRMLQAVADSDQELGTRLRSLTQLETTVIQPTLTREIRSEKRFTDPAAGITDGMRGAINAARATSASPCVTNADGSATCSLPPARPAGR